MLEGRDILIVGLQPWDIEIGSNCKNIAIEFAKHNRVVYVNPPVDRISYLLKKKDKRIQKYKKIRAGVEPQLVKIANNLWTYYPSKLVEPVNAIPDGFLFDFVNKVNGTRFGAEIRNVIKELNFNNFYLFNDNSIYLGYYLNGILNPSYNIYYIRDFLIKNPYWKKHALRIEPLLIAKADLVVANSQLYTTYSAQFNTNSYMVGQGCDISLYTDIDDSISIAEELKKIPGPIVGYTGYLTSRRLNIPLLKYLAVKKPAISFVLIGPEDEVFRLSELHTLQNIYFLGRKDGKELPSYIKGFEVAINPQLINEATDGNYPRKIDEYLSMGKPVVASATSAMKYFEDVTYLADSFESYSELIDLAIVENNSQLIQKRMERAASHSWENNVRNIYNCINQVEYQSLKFRKHDCNT